MAGLLPPAVAAPLKKTYHEYYLDPSEDPYGSYQGVLASFTIPPGGGGPAPIGPADLCDEFYNSSSAGDPNAFIVLEERDPGIEGHETGLIVCYHRLAKYPSRTHVETTPWDDLGYASLGEVVHGHVQTVAWENTMFHQTANIRVPTVANVTAWLGADPDLELLGPYDPADAGTDVVRGRNSCFLPPPFVPLFLNAPLKPRDAWEQVALQVLARDAAFVTACQPLLDWLRMAITREAVNFPSSIIRVQLEASVATPALLNHRHQLLI